jgi:hypothetical protein
MASALSIRSRMVAAGMGRFSMRIRRWNSSGIGGFQPGAFVDVVGENQGDGAVIVADPANDSRQHVGQRGADDHSLN